MNTTLSLLTCGLSPLLPSLESLLPHLSLPSLPLLTPAPYATSHRTKILLALPQPLHLSLASLASAHYTSRLSAALRAALDAAPLPRAPCPVCASRHRRAPSASSSVTDDDSSPPAAADSDAYARDVSVPAHIAQRHVAWLRGVRDAGCRCADGDIVARALEGLARDRVPVGPGGLLLPPV